MFIKFHNQCVNLFDSHKAILKSINSSSHHSVTVDTLLSEGGGSGGGGVGVKSFKKTVFYYFFFSVCSYHRSASLPGQHFGAAGSSVAPQQEGHGFVTQLGLMGLGVVFTCPPLGLFFS